MKEPDTLERTAWHQDLGYFHVDGDADVHHVVPARPCDPVDAARCGSCAAPTATGTLYRPNLFVRTSRCRAPKATRCPTSTAGGYDLVAFDLEPGDIIVHHARAPCTPPVATARRRPRRRAISVRYCGDDARVRIRAGAPLKPHQHGLTDGDRLGGDAHPQVWPAARSDR